MGDANRGRIPRAEARTALVEMLSLVGLDSLAQPDEETAVDAEAQTLLAEREQARATKDFTRADEIRDRLAAMGWEVRDSAAGAKLVPRSAPSDG